MTLLAIRRTIVPFITAWIVGQYLDVIEAAPDFLVDLLPDSADVEAWVGGTLFGVVFTAIYSGGNWLLVRLQAAAEGDGLVATAAGYAARAVAFFLGGAKQPSYTEPEYEASPAPMP